MRLVVDALGAVLLIGVALGLFAGSLSVLRRSRARSARLGEDTVAVDTAVLARWGWVPVPVDGVTVPPALSAPGAVCEQAATPRSGELAGSVLAVQVRFPTTAPFGWADGPVVWAVELGSMPPTGVLVVDRRREGSGGVSPDRVTGDVAFDAHYRVLRWDPTAERTTGPSGPPVPTGSSPGPAVRQRVVDLAADHLVVQGDRSTAAWSGPLDPARLFPAATALTNLCVALRVLRPPGRPAPGDPAQ